MESFLKRTEYALANLATDYVIAANSLNPLVEAEALLLGSAVAAYSGQFSPMHGVIGLGLEGAVEDAELKDLEEFFLRAGREAEFIITPDTHPSLLDYLHKYKYVQLAEEHVYECDLKSIALTPLPPGFSSTPDHGIWSLAFSRTDLAEPNRTEANLFSTTMMFLRNTRFFTYRKEGSFTYFDNKLALSQHQNMASEALLEATLSQAKDFQCDSYAILFASPLTNSLAEKFKLHKTYSRFRYGKDKDKK